MWDGLFSSSGGGYDNGLSCLQKNNRYLANGVIFCIAIGVLSIAGCTGFGVVDVWSLFHQTSL